MERKNLRKETLWRLGRYLIAFGVLLGGVYFGIHRYLLQEESITKALYLQDILTRSMTEYRAVDERMSNESVTHLLNRIQRPEVIALMERAISASPEEQQKLRIALFELMQPTYEALQKEMMILHFHLPDATSFLRMHKLEKFGDDLTHIRPSLLKAMEEGRYVKGYEVGRLHNAFRHVIPLYGKKGCVGSVEISYLLDVFLSHLEKTHARPFEFLIKKEHIDRHMWAEGKHGLLQSTLDTTYTIQRSLQDQERIPDLEKIDRYLAPLVKAPLKAHFAFAKSVEVPRYGKVIATFLPIHTIGKKHVGWIVSYITDTRFDTISSGYSAKRYGAAGFLILLFLFALFLTYQGWLNTLKRLYYDTVFNSQNDFMIITQGQEISEANLALLEFFGYKSLKAFKKEHSCVCDFFERVDEPDYIYKDKGGKNWLKTVLEFPEIMFKVLVIRDGRRHIFTIEAHPLHFDRHDRSVVLLRDMTQMLEAQRILEQKVQERTEELNEYIEIVDRNVISTTTDRYGVLTDFSHAFMEISGYERHELLGKSHNIVRHPESDPVLFEELWKEIKEGQVWHGEMKNLRKNGELYWVDARIYPRYDDAGEIDGYTAIKHDITDRKRIEYLSVTDALTELYNRRYFNTLFESWVSESRHFSLLVMDVDYFKRYNDTYGHLKGDKALKSVGVVLQSCVKEESKADAFRLGGEEFGVLFEGQHNDALVLAEKIRAEIERLGIEHLHNTGGVLTLSIGVACNYVEGRYLSSESIYGEADAALYRAKSAGRNRVIGS